MKVLIIILRVIVLLSALVGVGLSALVGWGGYVGISAARAELDKNRRLVQEIKSSGKMSQGELAVVELASRTGEGAIKSIPFFLLAALLGLIGGILAVCGWTGSGGIWLLTAAVGPTILFPIGIPFLSPLYVAAGLSLLAWLLSFLTQPKAEPEPDTELEAA